VATRQVNTGFVGKKVAANPKFKAFLDWALNLFYQLAVKQALDKFQHVGLTFLGAHFKLLAQFVADLPHRFTAVKGQPNEGGNVVKSIEMFAGHLSDQGFPFELEGLDRFEWTVNGL
jgi:hypothetical protein